MSRRTLSPAARGVLLAVSAALRGRVATIDDAGDGTTHACVVEPDGTVLLDVRVRAVGRRDARQPALPLAPGPRHETPAPVATLPDTRQPEAPEMPARPRIFEPLGIIREDEPMRIRGLAVGDRVTLDGEPVEVMGVDVHGFVWRTVATDARGRSVDEGDCEWSDVDETAPGVFRVRAVDIETPAQKRATKPARVAKAKPARLTPEPEADALTIHDEVCVVGQQEPGGPWELAASGRTVPPETWTTARGAYHRLRQYARGGRCSRDSADEAAS